MFYFNPSLLLLPFFFTFSHNQTTEEDKQFIEAQKLLEQKPNTPVDVARAPIVKQKPNTPISVARVPIVKQKPPNLVKQTFVVKKPTVLTQSPTPPTKPKLEPLPSPVLNLSPQEEEINLDLLIQLPDPTHKSIAEILSSGDLKEFEEEEIHRMKEEEESKKQRKSRRTVRLLKSLSHSKGSFFFWTSI